MKDEEKWNEIRQEAYNMGFSRGGIDKGLAEDIFGKEKVSEDEADREFARNFDSYTQSAGYTNHVLPKLRNMAGFEDTGHSSYRKIPEDKDQAILDEKLDELIMSFENGMIDSGLDDLKQMGKIKSYEKSKKVS